jgi:hypothetical protein
VQKKFVSNQWPLLRGIYCIMFPGYIFLSFKAFIFDYVEYVGINCRFNIDSKDLHSKGSNLRQVTDCRH